MTNAYKIQSRERLDPTPETSRQSVKVDESLERLSWLMDDLIRIPGINWRVGLDALVGLIPGFGDTQSPRLFRAKPMLSERGSQMTWDASR